MTRGGKREGAGRPVGTIKDNSKKMFSFRLSQEEEKAVRKLLAVMRKGGNMTKFEKIKTYDIETFAKWLKQFSSFEDDWRILRVWLESDGNEGLLEE